MNVTFHCYIEEGKRGYYKEPQLNDNEYTREFDIEFPAGIALPRVGEDIIFDELIEDIDEPWAEVFYNRSWEVQSVFWKFNKETKYLQPLYYLKDMGK